MNHRFRILAGRRAWLFALAVVLAFVPASANHDPGREGFPIAQSITGNVKDVVKAPSGSVYALVEYQDPLTFTFATGTTTIFTPTGTDLGVVKYDSRAQPVWFRPITNADSVRGGEMGIDSGENVYFIGTAYRSDAQFGSIPIEQPVAAGPFPTPDTNGQRVAFVAKLSSSGSPLWARTVESTSTTGGFGFGIPPQTDAIALAVSPGDLAAFPPVQPAVFVAGNAVCGDVVFDGAASQPSGGSAACQSTVFFGPSGDTVFPGGDYGDECDQLIEVLDGGTCDHAVESKQAGSWYGRIDPDGQWEWTEVDVDAATLTRRIECNNNVGGGAGNFFGNNLCFGFSYGYSGRYPQPITVTDLTVDESGAVYALSEAAQGWQCPDPNDQQFNIDRFATVNPIDGVGNASFPNSQVSGDLCQIVVAAEFIPDPGLTTFTEVPHAPTCNIIAQCTRPPARTSLLRIDEGLDPLDPLSTFAPTVVPVETLDDGAPYPAGSVVRDIAAVGDGELFSAGNLPGGQTIRVNKLRENPPGTVVDQWSLDNTPTGAPLQVQDLGVVAGEAVTSAFVTGSYSGDIDFGGALVTDQSAGDLFVAQAIDQISSASWSWGTGILSDAALTAPSLDADAGSVIVAGDVGPGAFDVTFENQTSVHTDGPSYLISQFRADNGELLQVENIIVGQAIEDGATFEPPPNAVLIGDIPQVFINGVQSQSGDAFVWSPRGANPDGRGRLFITQPASFVEIRWPTTTSIGAVALGEFTTSLGRAVYPDEADRDQHAGAKQADESFVSAPVEIVPDVPPSAAGALSFVRVIPQPGELNGATVDAGVFTTQGVGVSVLHFIDGDEADPELFPSRFVVAHTRQYSNLPDYSPAEACTVGTKLDPPTGAGAETGRVGHVLLDNSFYDGVGPDAAYSRADRTGTIIPVNRISPPRNPVDDVGPDTFKEMAVAWYKLRGPDDPSDPGYTGIYWPSDARTYDCDWPNSPDVIAIDSEQGSGQLSPTAYPAKTLYSQSNVDLPGYNPNDEHALFRNNGQEFESLFALRSDFGTPIGRPQDASDPYALLKYFENGEWKFRVYQVVATETPLAGQSPFTRGVQPLCESVGSPPSCSSKRITSYFPLYTLGDACAESRVEGEQDGDAQPPLPFFRDVNADLWPRAAGSGQIKFWYRLQPDFFYDLDSDDTSDVGSLECVPFLARLPVAEGGTADPNEPVDTGYEYSWPTPGLTGTLLAGETVYSPPKNGIPAIAGQAAAEVVFDELQQQTLEAGTYDPTRTLVRMFRPITPHQTPLSQNDFNDLGFAVDFDSGKFKILANDTGTVRLSPSLQLRLRYDPIAEMLEFGGADGSGSQDNPLIATNIMSDTDYANLLALAPASSTWDPALLALRQLSRNPNNPQLIDPATCTPDASGPVVTVRAADCTSQDRDWPPNDNTSLIGISDSNDDGIVDPAKIVGGGGALTAGFAQAEGWVTLAFNNELGLGGQPVGLDVIRVGCHQTPRVSPYQGEVFVIEPSNLFEESVTLRHSGDFAGQTDDLLFTWYYHEDTTGLSPDPPTFGPGGDLNGWTVLASGLGLNEYTLSTSDPVKVIGDGWVFARYQGLPVCNNTASDPEPNHSLLAGGPAGTPSNEVAQLNQGWVKRVIGNLNQFEARVKEFHKAETNTYASLIAQLGRRFEGAIPLNNDPANLNSIGLIEAYETVMRRALALTVDAGINSNSANNAILLVATRLSDFYLLLGSEAFSDAIDPTIGFSTEDTDIGLGTLAPTIFAFQEQLASLLDEELSLLRGRNAALGEVTSGPVYNRLFWNFTGAEGEAAYFQTYNLSDVDATGVIDADDARIFFPQGHGDAWGHYLTALRKHYDLLKKQAFTWVPRIESVRVGTDSVPVDYQDERKFAKAALLRARAGSEIVDLTYRQNYVEDVDGQSQGYKDLDPERAWGVDGWGRRAGQAAYFDWITGNSLLPAVDIKRCDLNGNAPKCHNDIQVIERARIAELTELAAEGAVLQTTVDQADRGLNPLGLAKGVVPFDIDPARVDDGETHFEQIFERATSALANGVTTWNRANQLTRHLRRNQDSVAEFQQNVIDADFDLTSRLKEIYGTPYPDDIGPGGAYPAGFPGWDLLHANYIDLAELIGVDATGANVAQQFETFDVELSQMPAGLGFHGTTEDFTCTTDPRAPGCALGPTPTLTKTVSYTKWDVPGFGKWQVKPPSWNGQRAVTGEIQVALQELAQAILAYKQGIIEYNNLAADAESQLTGLEDFFNVSVERIRLSNAERAQIAQLGDTVIGLRATSTVLQTTFDEIARWSADAASCVPKVIGLSTDALSVPRCSVTIGAFVTSIGLIAGAQGFEIGAQKAEQAIEDTSLQAAIQIDLLESRLELANMIADFEAIMREEPVLRAELFQGAQAIVQALQVVTNTYSEGARTMEQLVTFRGNSAAAIQEYRYEDFTFRIFRNEALQKYLAALEMASKFTFLAATAYDYDTNLLGDNAQSGQGFLQDIVRQRNLGQIQFGEAIPGSAGLADPLGRMSQNFSVLKGQMGFNNPQLETNRFSLRREHFDIDDVGASGDIAWRDKLREFQVDNLWDIPEFRRYARPFAPESLGDQPGLVIPFDSTVSFGLNFFGNALEAQDSAYSTANFSTRIRAVGVWFDGYEGLPLSNTPRVYLIPVGSDVLRAAEANNFEVRDWSVVDQVLPLPFPIGAGDLDDPGWTPGTDTLSDVFGQIRRYSDFRAYEYEDGAIESDEFNTDSRLIGRSVWNRRWLLIIPGGNLLADPAAGLELLINGDPNAGPGAVPGIGDIRLFFQTYAYSGS